MVRKKIFYFSFLFFFFCLAAPASQAQNQKDQEKIANWQTIINVQPNSSLNVKETIIYDFGRKKRKSFLLNLPQKYQYQGKSYNLRLSNFQVTDKNGARLPFAVRSKNKNKQLIINSQNKLFSGRQTYIISFQASGAISYLADFDQFYWPVVAGQREAKILQIQAIVNLPRPAAADKIKTACLIGSASQQKNCISTRYIYSGPNKVKGFSFVNGRLNSKQAMAVSVSWPKGLVKKASWPKELSQKIKNNWLAAGAGLAFLLAAGWGLGLWLAKKTKQKKQQNN